VLVFCLSTIASAEPTLSGAQPASGEGLEDAKQKFTSGGTHYQAGEWAEAVADFVEAYRLSRAPELLYDIAQAERHAGSCGAALAHYRQFKASGAEVPIDLDDKIALMEACTRSSLPSHVVPEAKATVRIQQPPPDLRITAAPRNPTRFALGVGSAAGALVSAALGTMFALRAHVAADRVNEATRPGETWGSRYQAYQSSGQRSEAAALGCFGASGVLAGLAAWLLVWNRPALAELPTVAMDAKPGSMVLTGSWIF